MIARDNLEEIRGSGRTTRQMRAAPPGAIFVWCNSQLEYPRELARKIGREDLRIEGPSFISDNRWHGLRPAALVIDHACISTSKQREALDYFNRLAIG